MKARFTQRFSKFCKMSFITLYCTCTYAHTHTRPHTYIHRTRDLNGSVMDSTNYYVWYNTYFELVLASVRLGGRGVTRLAVQLSISLLTPATYQQVTQLTSTLLRVVCHYDQIPPTCLNWLISCSVNWCVDAKSPDRPFQKI